MESNQILSAHVLDILFEGKNKEYGAYELRKTYNARAATALCFSAITIIVFLCSFISKGDNSIKKPAVIDITPPTEIPDEPKPLAKPLKQIAPRMRTIAFVPPIIVKDILVKDIPVENADLDDAKISVETTEGPIDEGIPAPVEAIKGSKVIEAPHPPTDDKEIKFTPVEIEAQFKGDWGSYLRKEIEKHLDELTEAGESGTCQVKFIVYKDGTVSNVEATTMKGTKLAEIAVNAIRKGPKWTPAIQNGQPVNAYRMQPVSFQLEN